MQDERVRSAVAAAQAETESILDSDPTRSIADPTLPIYRVVAGFRLEELGKAFAAGDRGALMAALRVCANHDLPMPQWLSKAYIRSYDQVLTCRVKSWDEAFGAPFPKGANLNALRKRRELRYRIGLAVLNRIQRYPDMPIDKGLFEAVGKEFNVGASLAEELYYSAVKQGLPSAADWKKKAGWK